MNQKKMNKFEISEGLYYAEYALVPGQVLAMLASSILNLDWFACAFAGLLLWTLFEYVLHVSSHHINVLKGTHDFHHDHPAAFIGPASWWTLGMYVVLLTILAVVLGLNMALGLMVGFMSGYAAFLYTHDAIHRKYIGPESFLYKLKLHHVAHHKYNNIRFGVVTTLWDRVFLTYHKRN